MHLVSLSDECRAEVRALTPSIPPSMRINLGAGIILDLTLDACREIARAVSAWDQSVEHDLTPVCGANYGVALDDGDEKVDPYCLLYEGHGGSHAYTRRSDGRLLTWNSYRAGVES